MKKFFSLAAVLVLLISCLPFAALADTPVTINVYNWGQYISDGSDGYIDVNAAFTAATGIRVNYMTYDSNETLYTKLKTGGSSYDVIIPSDYMIARLIDEGMLLELDFANIPNYQYVDEAYQNTSYDPDNKYSVPYTWGTVGVIYNSAHVDEADTGSWDLLWNEKYAGKILMFDNPRDAFGAAELLLGIDVNSTDEADLRAAAEKLIEQKPLVQSYVMDQIYDKMERSEAWVAPYYAGDYLMMVEENEDLRFYFPEEGFNLFIDAMCVPTSSLHKAEAEAYINFLCSPEVSGQNLEYLGYSTPSAAAKDFMSEDVTSSGIAYPSAEILARGHSFNYLPAETNQLMDSLWLDVKTGGGSALLPAVMGVTGFILLIAAYFIWKRVTAARRKANRGKQ